MELPAAAPRRKLHTRDICCEGYVRDDGLWEIEASILDTKTYTYQEPYRGERPPLSAVHQMKVRLTLDDALTVTDIHVAMPDTPYPICPQAAARFKGLIGASIGAGWRRKVNEVVGGTNGCTHVRELLFPMATVAIQTVRGWEESNPPEGKPGVRRPLLDNGDKAPAFIDGCYAWSAEREVVAKVYPHMARKPSDGG